MASRQVITQLLARADIKVNGTRPGDIAVHDNSFFDAILSGGSLALGESYVAGIWDCKHIDVFADKLLRAQLDKHIPKNLTTLHHFLRAKLVNRESKRRAWEVGRRHYDIGNDLYTAMLDREQMYSCAYWKDATNLDDAQIAKLDLICRKLDIKKGDQVLDIGCGWGGMARYAAKEYGATVTGITISKEQHTFATKKAAELGLPCTFVLEDYRIFAEQCRKENRTFDAIISIGMFEHVGYKNYRTYLQAAHSLLKDDGKFLLHTIGGLESTTHTDPWIEEYVFPNSMLPSIAQVAKATEGLFVVEDLHNFGPYYDRTLMAWHSNFEQAWPKLAASNPKYTPQFRRMWSYYLLMCAGSFRARKNQLWQFVLAKNPTQIYHRTQ